MRTVANVNENANGSTNDPNPLPTDSTGSGIGSKEDKVSTRENRVDIPGSRPIEFTGSTETQAGLSTDKVSTKEKASAKTDLPTVSVHRIQQMREVTTQQKAAQQ